jgi:adenylate cyclase
MVEDIITGLSRSRSLFVIARNSSFTYKGKAVDIKQVGRELGVRYVLEGSVRKSGNRVRITAAGTHSSRYDSTLEDIFDLQDRVTMSVIGAIAPQLARAEIARAQRKPTESLQAYDYYLRALASSLYARSEYRGAQAHPDGQQSRSRLRSSIRARSRLLGPKVGVWLE